MANSKETKVSQKLSFMKKIFHKKWVIQKKSFHRHLKQNKNDYFERKDFVSHFQLTVITLLGEFIGNF